MNAKFVCYHLKNTGEICGNGCDKPEGCHLHCKAKLRRPCSVCSRPTKIGKPSGLDNDLCSYCNKSNYQTRHVNKLRVKALLYDKYTSEVGYSCET
ncbi:hypothetical protein RclHR1_28780001 [Rhizophagus clarus]|uniref:Uncharacterized protein n=1 Tax=Rhizophagus clarus TaxID=94130 RepID=A0A2Z6R3F9_9GLOM|nr:hypothetical protein RclHR1_28780001 [Rhizophagus clarus]GES97760.1 hypothetical protein GLOIN_2v1480993 [Rhizophagus clarus]GET02543.1 hypothetical protein GLOIN_2v1480993 [Rhizophagus clarus]